MKVAKILGFLLSLVILVGLLSGDCHAQSVVVINVKGEINNGQVSLIQRAFRDAELKNAAAVVIEIDTFGGLVDSAVNIRDRIAGSPLTTICYIKNRAWSAGALVALASKHIAIAPGGSIGAAEPIPATEKTVAALKAEFASTANMTGRNARVAEAMVDKTLGFPGYAEPGQILALTDYQAKQLGYADIIAADRKSVLNEYGLAGAETIEYSQEWSDKFVGWISDPTIKSFLLSIIFLAVLTEIKTAGLGVAAAIGLVAAVLFFGSQWLIGVAGWMGILLFIGGIVLILVELFVPGVGIFGIAGFVSIVLSIFLTLGGNLTAVNIMVGSLALAVIVFLIMLKYLPSSKYWNKLILKDEQTAQAGFTSSQSYDSYVGKEGLAVTSLRPAGTVEIEGVNLSVVAEGYYVDKGTKVKVVSVSGSKIVVKPIKE